MVNTEFEKNYNIYMDETICEDLRNKALHRMIQMWNNLEITIDEYQEKYQNIFPEMDKDFFEIVDPNTF